MLEYFSTNATITLGAADTESIVPFQNQKILKGCTAAMSGNSVQLNKCGVYDIDCDLCFAVSAACDLTFTVYVDGIAQPQSVRTVTVADADTFCTTHIATYVTKQDDNCRCNLCTAPTNVYVAVSASVADIDVTLKTSDIQVFKPV